MITVCFLFLEKEEQLTLVCILSEEMPVKLIYAYGITDDIGYHKTLCGSKEVNLLNYMPRASIPDSKYFDLTMTNVRSSYFYVLLFLSSGNTLTRTNKCYESYTLSRVDQEVKTRFLEDTTSTFLLPPYKTRRSRVLFVTCCYS